MAIKNVILRGFGNGTVSGTIPLVVTRGYSIGGLASTLVGRWSNVSKIDIHTEQRTIDVHTESRYIDE